MRTIDSHAHVWDRVRSPYRWLDNPEFHAIAGTRRIGDLLQDLEQVGVQEAILVQADDTDADTDNMLAEASHTCEIVGIVAYLPLDEPDQASARLENLRRRGRIVGVRSLIHDREDRDWILRSDVGEGLELLEREGIAFDYVTSRSDALVHLPALAERHPELTIVLDHLGKPPSGRDLGPWRRELTTAASNPLLSAKLSGLYPIETDLLRPAVDAALEIFGPSRAALWG